jgi:hypothetical protein
MDVVDFPDAYTTITIPETAFMSVLFVYIWSIKVDEWEDTLAGLVLRGRNPCENMFSKYSAVVL